MRASRTHRRARKMVPLKEQFKRSNARKCEDGFTYSPRTPQATVAVPQGDDSSTHRDDDAVVTDSGYARFWDKSSNSWRLRVIEKRPRTPSREQSEEIAGTEVHDGDGDSPSPPLTTEDEFESPAERVKKRKRSGTVANRDEPGTRPRRECTRRTRDQSENDDSPIEAREKKLKDECDRIYAKAVKKMKKKTTPKATGKKVPWTHDEDSYLEKLYRDKKGNMSEGDFEKYASRKISARSKNKRTQYAVRHRMNETNLKKLKNKKHCKLPNGRRVSRSSGRNWTPSEESTLRSLVKRNREAGRPEYEGVPELLERKFGHLRTTDACKQHFRKIENKDDASEVTDEEESESQLLTENTENEGSLNESMQQERPEHEHEIRMLRLRHAHDREMAQMLYEQDKEMAELMHKQSLTTH